MTRKLAIALVLAVEGLMFLTLALADWMIAKINVSERGYLLPLKVAGEFHSSIVAAWHGQNRSPSLLACRHWDRKVCGPIPEGAKTSLRD
jgi:hypothetical protein